MQTVYARGGGGGIRQRQVADWADGADVVFTDTELYTCILKPYKLYTLF